MSEMPQASRSTQPDKCSEYVNFCGIRSRPVVRCRCLRVAVTSIRYPSRKMTSPQQEEQIGCWRVVLGRGLCVGQFVFSSVQHFLVDVSIVQPSTIMLSLSSVLLQPPLASLPPRTGHRRDRRWSVLQLSPSTGIVTGNHNHKKEASF
jgi:hypothetical protein